MHGNSTRENRETPAPPVGEDEAGRLEKVLSSKSNMHVAGESEIVQYPRSGGTTASTGRRHRGKAIDQGEHRAGNPATDPALDQRVERVARVPRRDKRTRFTALLHHVTTERLRDSYYALRRDAAPGVDGVTWQEYEPDLDEKLADLHRRIHRGTYRAQPSRRTYIAKADGRQRPLGIAALEDKIVQHVVVMVLNQIYEEDFLGFSYGFQPGRSQHQALDARWVGIMRKKVNWILDADVRGFFDNLSHEWLVKFIEHRVADQRILRLIRKWLRVGVSEVGEWSKTEVGTPQGSVATPLRPTSTYSTVSIFGSP
jgi:RNA-directed DNA polymerase